MLSLKISIILCRDSGTAESLPSSRSGSIFALPERFTTYIIYIQTHIFLKRKKGQTDACELLGLLTVLNASDSPLLLHFCSTTFQWSFIDFTSLPVCGCQSTLRKKWCRCSTTSVLDQQDKTSICTDFFFIFLTSLSSPENYSRMRRKKKWKWDLRKKITSSPPFLCKLGTDTQSWMEIIIHAGNLTPCHVTHCRLTLTGFLNISIMSNNITLIISFSMDFLDTILNENILSLILKCHMCVFPLYP